MKFEGATFAKPIDMKAIVKKSYDSFKELCEDFSWFTHNCLTKYSNQKILKAAVQLPKTVDDEIYNLLLCEQCYANAYHHPDRSFTMLCNPPHALLWVDCHQFGYWPAKLMRVENDDSVTVRFFGDWTNATVKHELCLMYSEEVAKNKHGAGTGPPFKMALQVINILLSF